eukprot:15440166-Alexandrium_andersonii.AAC.1
MWRRSVVEYPLEVRVIAGYLLSEAMQWNPQRGMDERVTHERPECEPIQTRRHETCCAFLMESNRKPMKQ